MAQDLIRLATALLAATLFALLGFMSAGEIAPDRESAGLAATRVALGLSADDLCADGREAHAHTCPVCQTLPDPPALALERTRLSIVPPGGWRQLASITGGPNPERDAIHARAPPVLI